jgi:hypothetical protein
MNISKKNAESNNVFDVKNMITSKNLSKWQEISFLCLQAFFVRMQNIQRTQKVC